MSGWRQEQYLDQAYTPWRCSQYTRNYRYGRSRTGYLPSRCSTLVSASRRYLGLHKAFLNPSTVTSSSSFSTGALTTTIPIVELSWLQLFEQRRRLGIA